MCFKKRLFTLPEQIAIQIKEAILHGEFHLGDRLPPEKELADLFGVSRSTVRDALNLLRTENIIQTQKGKFGGHFLVQKASEQMVHHLSHPAFTPLNLSILSWEQIFEVRLLIEVPLAGLASLRRTDEDLASLETLLQRSEDLSDVSYSSYPFLQANITFQRILVQACHNPLFVDISDVLIRLLEIASLQLLLTPNQQQTMYEHLKAIYNAIKDRNASQAEQAMSAYLRLFQRMTPESTQGSLQ